MTAMGIKHLKSRIFAAAVLLLIVFSLVRIQDSRASASMPYVNAFSVTKLPKSYPSMEAFFASLRNTGANTVIIDLPMTDAGFPAMNVIPNVVYLAHQAGFKLFVVLPTRRLDGPLSKHDDWEDMRYDLSSERYERTGKLDLFQQPAVDYLAALAKELAAFSVDAVLLGRDFSYGPTEGMSRFAVNDASQRLGSDLHPSKLYRKIENGPDGPFVRNFTELFQRWTALKRDRLLAVYQAIAKSVHTANSTVKVGIPVPITYPLMNTGEIFTQHSYDMNAFRNLNVDYFWTGIPYRALQKQQGLSNRQTTELVSRIAHAAVTASKDAAKTIIVVPMADENASQNYPFSEIEEITALIKQAGETGRAYGINPGVSVNREFTNKLFRRQ